MKDHCARCFQLYLKERCRAPSRLYSLVYRQSCNLCWLNYFTLGGIHINILPGTEKTYRIDLAHDSLSHVEPAGGNFELDKSNKNKSNHPKLKRPGCHVVGKGCQLLLFTRWDLFLYDIFLASFHVVSYFLFALYRYLSRKVIVFQRSIKCCAQKRNSSCNNDEHNLTGYNRLF